MSEKKPDPSFQKHALQSLFVWLLFFGVVCFYQWRQQAWVSEFGAHPDEAAHFVTGLFVRDSIQEAVHFFAQHESPVKVGKAFAEQYYDHYPKIALGVWPPVFYLVQSTWTLIFSPQRCSILLLIACTASLLALIVYWELRKNGNSVASATFGGVILLSLPLIQQYSAMVMAEVLSALLMLCAMLRWGAFLDNGRVRDGLLFGVWSTLAILTKGTGLALVFAGPLSLVLTRRWGRLKNPGFLGAVICVLAIAGPWTWKTRNLGHGGWLYPSPCWKFTMEALAYYGEKTLVSVGVLLAGVAILGAIVSIGDQSPPPGKWVSMIALLFGVLIFQAIAPVGLEARHLTTILAPIVLCGWAGLEWIARRMASGVANTLVYGAVGAIFFLTPLIQGQPAPHFGSIGNQIRISPFMVVRKATWGFGPVAQKLMFESPAAAKFLVSSDANGEGMFISEIAMRDPMRPSRIAHRASKILGSSEWRGGNYRPLFDNEEAVMAALQKGAYRYVVIDDSIPPEKRKPHHDLLKQTIANHPDKSIFLDSFDVQRGPIFIPAAVTLYQLKAP